MGTSLPFLSQPEMFKIQPRDRSFCWRRSTLFSRVSIILGCTLFTAVGPIVCYGMAEVLSESSLNKRLTVSFEGISAESALKLISDFTGVTFVETEQLSDVSINVELQDVTAAEVLRVILGCNGFGLVEHSQEPQEVIRIEGQTDAELCTNSRSSR
jgi:hypothetical protein